MLAEKTVLFSEFQDMFGYVLKPILENVVLGKLLLFSEFNIFVLYVCFIKINK